MQEKPKSGGRAGLNRPAMRRIVLGLIVIASAAGAVFGLGLKDEVATVLEWTSAQGPIAPLVFVGIMALVVLFIVPSVIVTTGAGFLFGVAEGTACVVIGTTVGAAIAFLAARFLFGTRARRFVESRAGARIADEEIGRHGWKLVLLTRLLPLFPGKMSNYVFGMTSVSFRGFVTGTFVGVIPFSLHNAYLGSLAADMTVAPDRAPDSPIGWAVVGTGFLATVAAAAYVSWVARRMLGRAGQKVRVDR